MLRHQPAIYSSPLFAMFLNMLTKAGKSIPTLIWMRSKADIDMLFYIHEKPHYPTAGVGFLALKTQKSWFSKLIKICNV